MSNNSLVYNNDFWVTYNSHNVFLHIEVKIEQKSGKNKKVATF